MRPPQTLLFTANSQGEIAGWLRPLVRQARRSWPATRIVVILLPCTFASGSEGRVAHDLVGVDEVVPASRFLRLLAWEGSRFGRATLVHLGGDLMYSALLSWRWGLRSWSYMWGRWWWDRAFQGYFVKDQAGVSWLARRRIPTGKAHVVGDLVADAVQVALEDSPAPCPVSGRLVSFLPGSRLHEVENLSPFFLAVAELLARSRPDLRFQMLLSPFVEADRADRALQTPPHPKVGGLPGRLRDGMLVSPGGVEIRIVRQGNLSALAGSTMAITIPGTKTAEAACLGVPHLMILPLNRPEMLPFVGLIGLLDWLPGGGTLKGQLLLRMKDRAGFLAQPNLLAGEALVREMIDVLTPEAVAAEASSMLDRPGELASQAVRLRELYRTSQGAAQRIFECLEN